MNLQMMSETLGLIQVEYEIEAGNEVEIQGVWRMLPGHTDVTDVLTPAEVEEIKAHVLDKAERAYRRPSFLEACAAAGHRRMLERRGQW